MHVSQHKLCHLNQLLQLTNLPQSIIFPTSTSLSQKITLTLEPISPFLFSLWYRHLFPTQQKFWTVPPQRTTFQYANQTFPRKNICLTQRRYVQNPNFLEHHFPVLSLPYSGPKSSIPNVSVEPTTAQYVNPSKEKSSLQKSLSPLRASQIPSICSTTNKSLTLTAELTSLSLEQAYIYLPKT